MSERWNEIDDVDLMQMEAEMRGDLEDLREAAMVFADRAWARGGETAVRPAPRLGWRAWATASVAAAALLASGGVLAHRAAAPAMLGASSAPAIKVQAAPPVSDEALLEQIQSDLSSGVPAAMEPLQASDTRGAQDVVRR